MAEELAKPRRRVWRWVAIILGLLVVLPIAGVAIFLATLDLDQYKPRITAAAEQATGRRLELKGPIGLGLSLVPTLQLRDVAFANMAGGSRPEMVTVREVDIELALLPLLSKRVELRRLVLVAPDILLETNAQGLPNWQFQPAAAPPAQPAQPAQPAAGGPGLSFGVGRISITDGRFTYHDGQARRTHALVVKSLSLRSEDGTGPLRLDGDFVLDNHAFTLAGDMGPLARLIDAAEATNTTPFPVNLALEAEGGRFGLAGSIAQPQQGKGWRFELTARVPELARFGRWVPDVPLPALRNVQLSVTAADAGAPMPELIDVKLTIGESDLSAIVPELRLASLSVNLPRPDQPITLALDALLHGQPLKLAGTLGAPALLLPPGTPGAMQGAYPIDITLNAGSASGTVKGSIARPAQATGIDLAVGLRAPDVAALAPLAGGAALPPIKDLALEFRLAERSAAFASGAHLRGLRLTSSAADMTGELTLIIGQRTGLNGRLTSTRVNLDALQAPARPPAAGASAAAPPPPARNDGRVIPDTALPLDVLKLLEADLRWTIGEFLASGASLKDVVLVFAAQNGQARLDELSATSPGGRVQLRAAADVTTEPPTVQLSIRTDQLDAPALMNGLGMPNQAISGKIDLDVDVRGRGRTVRQVAAGLTGYAGIAVTSLQSRGNSPDTLLGRALQQLQQAVPAGGTLLTQGIGIACAAFRFDAEAGIARSRALFLDTTLGKIGGGGSVSLRDEQLNLRLDSDLSLPIPGISLFHIRAPIPVTGSFAAPRFDYGAVAAGAATGTVAGAAGQVMNGLGSVGGANNPLGGLLGGAAGAVTGTAGVGELSDCATQLALARSGRQGPVPASAAPTRSAAPARPAAPSAGTTPVLPGVGAVPQGLRGLFGR